MGQIPRRANIINIYLLILYMTPICTVQTESENDFVSGEFVRLTNLGEAGNSQEPAPHGSDQLNNGRYKIVVTDTDKFYLLDPITNKAINPTNFVPYVTGGIATIIEQTFVYHGDDE